MGRFALKYFINIWLSLAAVFLSLVLLEVIFGNWIIPDRFYPLGVLRNMALHLDASHLYPTSQKILYRRDRYGLRGAYPQTDHIDILTLGGSTTDQRFISEGETWQDVLHANFKRCSGQTVWVVNAGSDGLSTRGYVANFDPWLRQIPGLKPRYVLLYVGINDLHAYYSSDPENLSGFRFYVNQLKCAIHRKSALVNLYFQYRGTYRAQLLSLRHSKIQFEKLHWTTRPLIKNHQSLLMPTLEAYQKNLLILIRRCHEMGSMPILVTQPLFYYKIQNGVVYGVVHEDFSNNAEFLDTPLNGVDYFYFMKLINQRTLELCHETNAICIDLENELPFETSGHYDWTHYTPQGAQKIGDYLYVKLSQNPKFNL